MMPKASLPPGFKAWWLIVMLGLLNAAFFSEASQGPCVLSFRDDVIDGEG